MCMILLIKHDVCKLLYQCILKLRFIVRFVNLLISFLANKNKDSILTDNYL